MLNGSCQIQSQHKIAQKHLDCFKEMKAEKLKTRTPKMTSRGSTCINWRVLQALSQLYGVKTGQENDNYAESYVLYGIILPNPCYQKSQGLQQVSGASRGVGALTM